MLIRTSISLVAAFLGFTAVVEASGSKIDSNRQYEGFSSSVGPQGQYFGGTAPRPNYYYGHYDDSPSGSHRNHRKGMAPPANDGQHPPSRP
jgi:hypothetical protein